MPVSRSTKRMAVVFISAFLLCGVYRALLPTLPLTHGLIQLLCGSLTLIWMLTIQRRIIDRRLRGLMIAVAACLLLHFTLQIARYNLIQGTLTVSRILWYAMYLPMTAQAVLCCVLAAFIHRPKDASLPNIYWVLILLGALLALGYLTNDLHFQAKSFPSGVMDDNGFEKSGWLQYAISAYIVLCYVLSYAQLLQKTAPDDSVSLPDRPCLLCAVSHEVEPPDISLPSVELRRNAGLLHNQYA